MSGLSLADALDHYRAVTDSTHRFWSYFQILAVGLLSFLWLNEPPEFAVFVALTCFFLAFVYFNRRLVLGSQREAFVSSRAIKRYAMEHPQEVPEEFRAFIRLIAPEPVDRINDIYLSLTTAVVAAIWLRPFFW